jgi:hypothetical protein
LKQQFSPKRKYNLLDNVGGGAPCAYFDGIFNYFNLHKE